MAYREPGVTVTEEFANALPALASFALPNVNVGPVFQIVKQAAASGTYTGAAATFMWPSLVTGAVPDINPAVPGDLVAFPVVASLSNAIAELLAAPTGEVLAGNLNQLTDATVDAFVGIVAGDIIVVATGPLAGAYTVRSVVDVNTLQINETFAAAAATVSYVIGRRVGAVALNMSTVVLSQTLGVTVPVGVMTTVSPFGSVPVVSATVLVSYRALRLEYSSDVKEYASAAELQADFGIDQIVPENIVVYGAYLSLNNAVTKTNILALKADYLTDEVLAYSKAFDILKLAPDMYAISVMTQNVAVHTILSTHVTGMSVPTAKQERVGIINRTLITKEVVAPAITTGGAEGLGATGFILTSAASHFITDGVVPGHYIEITAPTLNAGRYQVASVGSQTQLTLVTAASAGAVNTVSFYVDRDLSLSEQASAFAAFARSIGNRRMVLTFPDVIKLPVGNAIRSLPGYFLNCSVGALTTGLPTQQGLTNLPVSMYTGVVHSTKYFDRDQLNTIADGGVMIFVQDILDQTALYVRHQLTTDRSAIKFQEYSVTKNVDFIAKFVRINHKQFIGQYNIVDGTFDDLKTNAKGICNYLAERTKLPKLGGVIKSGRLLSAVQDVQNIDTIIERYEMNIPIPLNNLDITIVV